MVNKKVCGYNNAKEKYAEFGVDTEKAIVALEKVAVSLHCWQGDDVAGFEKPDAELSSGGIQVTGNYPGRARNVKELRRDLEQVLSYLPGKHRVNLHAIYGEFSGKRVDRDEIESKHYEGWVDWSRGLKNKVTGLDFNATLFSHPKAAAGFTLSSRDPGIRGFWVEHVKRCRRITQYFGESCGSTSIHNLWIPDGMKDFCVNRAGYRRDLKDSLDKIYKTKLPAKFVADAVEPKLFGIGSEMFVVGSHEFYLSYALKNNLLLCLDLGHYHLTESIGDKVSALLQFFPSVLLHVSRGVRWDSDHVVVSDDILHEVMHEIVRAGAVGRVIIALDYFDASINRIGAWVTGARAVLKTLLYALLEPVKQLQEYESRGEYYPRLALLEQMKAMPYNDIWEEYCCRKNVISEESRIIKEILAYEGKVLNRR
ncbi:MAG: L-rhamnose isomerase [Elusimicrobiota bacterium]